MSPTDRFVGQTVRVNIRYIENIEPLEGSVMEAGPVGLVMKSGARNHIRLIPWTSIVTILLVEQQDPEDFLYQ